MRPRAARNATNWAAGSAGKTAGTAAMLYDGNIRTIARINIHQNLMMNLWQINRLVRDIQ